ncbi:hypothetical protein CBR_g20007 [Chara braunii]|uniref:Uncharacterized protein n=1 Tax=Chara braunii TaxID=69332 RepID=A0A388KZ89_CHABU|nr:hypothetical protein CBR_g20007 [Chara braunii]|eukprot:GBG75377.1 hypothetical protein CBR_g20007 [Chara braunii]
MVWSVPIRQSVMEALGNSRSAIEEDLDYLWIVLIRQCNASFGKSDGLRLKRGPRLRGTRSCGPRWW